jgi:hypothetical protein
MPPRWNVWATLQAVQFDYERTPKQRPARLAAATANVGDPVRIGMSGVEIEGRHEREHAGVTGVSESRNRYGHGRSQRNAPEPPNPARGVRVVHCCYGC